MGGRRWPCEIISHLGRGENASRCGVATSCTKTSGPAEGEAAARMSREDLVEEDLVERMRDCRLAVHAALAALLATLVTTTLMAAALPRLLLSAALLLLVGLLPAAA